MANGKTHQVRHVPQAQPFHDACTMCLNGFDTDTQEISNVLVRLSLHDQFQNLELARSETVKEISTIVAFAW